MRERLISARESHRMSQEELAVRIGRSRSAIAKYETGITDIPGSVLQKLQEHLGITIEDILFNNDDEDTSPQEPPHA